MITTASFSAYVDEVGDDANDGGIGALNGTFAATTVRLNGNLDADTLKAAAPTTC